MSCAAPAVNAETGILIDSARLVEGEVELSWKGRQGRCRFAPLWLRDHCHARHSLHPETLQRQVDTFAIPQDIEPAQLEILDSGRQLQLVWKHDGVRSEFPAAFLWDMAQSEAREPPARRRLWDRASMGESFPGVPFEEIMAGDAGLLRWLAQVEECGFALASGVPATPEATEKLVRRVGYVRETLFGGMWDFTANLAFKDTAYTPLPIGPHTDGTYSVDPPGLQMFHCLEFNGEGGQSTLVDGFRVAEEIRRSDPISFEVLTQVKVPAHYLGDGVHLRAEHPIIALDAHGECRQVSYNNYDRAPFRLPTPRMNAFYKALRLWNRLINDPAFEVSFQLLPGTALLFDNWRTLHGRRAYRGFRRLCGAYLNHEDFESRLRVLRSGSGNST